MSQKKRKKNEETEEFVSDSEEIPQKKEVGRTKPVTDDVEDVEEESNVEPTVEPSFETDDMKDESMKETSDSEKKDDEEEPEPETKTKKLKEVEPELEEEVDKEKEVYKKRVSKPKKPPTKLSVKSKTSPSETDDFKDMLKQTLKELQGAKNSKSGEKEKEKEKPEKKLTVKVQLANAIAKQEEFKKLYESEMSRRRKAERRIQELEKEWKTSREDHQKLMQQYLQDIKEKARESSQIAKHEQTNSQNVVNGAFQTVQLQTMASAQTIIAANNNNNNNNNQQPIMTPQLLNDVYKKMDFLVQRLIPPTVLQSITGPINGNSSNGHANVNGQNDSSPSDLKEKIPKNQKWIKAIDHYFQYHGLTQKSDYALNEFQKAKQQIQNQISSIQNPDTLDFNLLSEGEQQKLAFKLQQYSKFYEVIDFEEKHLRELLMKHSNHTVLSRTQTDERPVISGYGSLQPIPKSTHTNTHTSARASTLLIEEATNEKNNS